MSSIVLNGDTSGAVTLSAPSVAGTNTLTLPAATGNLALYQSIFSLKNRIINGSQIISQRYGTASQTIPANNPYYVTDRFMVRGTQASKVTAAQNAGSVTPPVGFTNYLGVTSSSAYSVTSTDYFVIEQRIEGFNIADLGFGTANAKTVTLSFQVYSSLTGTFGGSLTNGGLSRSYPFSYSIPAANTWTSISVTVPGDTTGTWTTDNSTGMSVFLSLGAGSTLAGTAGSWSGNTYVSATGAVSVVGTNGATFYVTGVQLEAGSAATTFDYRQYGQELALCERYYYGLSNYPIGLAQSSNYLYSMGLVAFPSTMRATPTIASGSSFAVNTGSAGSPLLVPLPTGVNGPQGVGLVNNSANWTTNVTVSFTGGFSAEL